VLVVLQVPLCKSCTTCPAHRLHHCQLISEAETSQFAELRGLAADLRAAKRGFERSLTSLQEALVRLRTDKDNVRDKIMMTTLIEKQLLKKHQVCSGWCPLLHIEFRGCVLYIVI